MSVKKIGRLWIYNCRYRVEVDSAAAGTWVLIEGIEQSITKTATLVDAE